LLRQKGVLTTAEVSHIMRGYPSDGEAPVVEQTAPPAQEKVSGSIAAITTESRFLARVYGTLLLNGIFNTAPMNITDVPLFTSKQGSDALGNDKAFAMTARQSRIGLRYDGREDLIGAKVSGQVEIDFLGGKAPFPVGANMDLLRLRLAYGRMDWDHYAIEAGQDWSIFAPLNPTSFAEYAIPSMAASGNPWIRMPQIRFEAKTSNFLAQFAAIDPNMGDYSTTSFSATRAPGVGERGRAPGAEARFALSAKDDDRTLTVGFSGHYARGKNAAMIGDTTEQLSLDSWGAAIDFSLPFSKMFSLSGEGYTGRALGIFSVTNGTSVQAVGTAGDRGVRSSCGWAQAQLSFTTKWQVNLVYGIDNPNMSDIPTGTRTRNQGYMANLIYKYTSHATAAWEYRRMRTDFRNQHPANEQGDTFNVALAYVF